MSNLHKQLVKKILSANKTNLIEKFTSSKELPLLLADLERHRGLSYGDLLGMGTSCIAFRKNNEVIKICSKHIKYLHHNSKSGPSDLQKRVEPLSEWLVPMKEIIFDGKEFFVYTQDICQPLDDKAVTTQVLDRILDIIQGVFASELTVGQIKPKNVGFVNGKLCLFDYHSMHELKYRMNDKEDWWSSLDKSLSHYVVLRAKNEKGDNQSTVNFSNRIARLMKYLKTAKASTIDLKKVEKLISESKSASWKKIS